MPTGREDLADHQACEATFEAYESPDKFTRPGDSGMRGSIEALADRMAARR